MGLGMLTSPCRTSAPKNCSLNVATKLQIIAVNDSYLCEGEGITQPPFVAHAEFLHVKTALAN